MWEWETRMAFPRWLPGQGHLSPSPARCQVGAVVSPECFVSPLPPTFPFLSIPRAPRGTLVPLENKESQALR